MKRTLIAIAMALALVLIPVGSAFAATTADVTVTATPGFVSITVTPDSWPAGTIIKDTDVDTLTTPPGGNTFTVVNASTVDMDLTIQCDGWTDIALTPEGTEWTYATPADEDTGSLNFSIDSGSNWTFLDNAAPVALTSAVAPATSPTFDLQLDAPTSFTHIDEQQTTVTLTAAPS